jgi:hypothetical protein
MKRIIFAVIVFACGTALPIQTAIQKHSERQSGTEVYTGTLIDMNGRMISTGFTLTITGRTSDSDSQRYLSILSSEGQSGLMKAIRRNNFGYIAATGQTRRNLLVVREFEMDGKRRIIAAFERWVGFYEVRADYRTLDYPFSTIEILLDRDGKGGGTFIGLAQVKMSKKTKQQSLRLDSYGNFPAKVMGVTRRR